MVSKRERMRRASLPSPRRARLTIRPPLSLPSFAKPRVRSSRRSGWGTRSTSTLIPLRKRGVKLLPMRPQSGSFFSTAWPSLARSEAVSSTPWATSSDSFAGAASRGGLVDQAMRRRRGAARASSTYEWSGRGGPPATPPWQTSSHSAESSTVRVTQPVTDRPCQCSRAGASEIRSRCGLSAEEAAERRGDADRAAAVRRGRAGAEARGGRGRRAAARPTGRAGGVPRVSRDPPRLGLGEAADGELGQVRLAEDDRPGGAQAADHLAVGLGRLCRSRSCPRS